MFKIFNTLEDAQVYCNLKESMLNQDCITCTWDIPRELNNGTYAVYSEDEDSVELQPEWLVFNQEIP